MLSGRCPSVRPGRGPRNGRVWDGDSPRAVTPLVQRWRSRRRDCGPPAWLAADRSERASSPATGLDWGGAARESATPRRDKGSSDRPPAAGGRREHDQRQAQTREARRRRREGHQAARDLSRRSPGLTRAFAPRAGAGKSDLVDVDLAAGQRRTRSPRLGRKAWRALASDAVALRDPART